MEYKNAYRLSRDYDRLWDLLSKGHEVVGYADTLGKDDVNYQTMNQRIVGLIVGKFCNGSLLGFTMDGLGRVMNIEGEHLKCFNLSVRRHDIAFIDPEPLNSSMSAEERMHTIATLCSANDASRAKLNKTASMSRHPMSKADRLRIHYLKQSNSCLKQAEFYILQAMAK